jgi:molybdate transport system ATP-binding protein
MSLYVDIKRTVGAFHLDVSFETEKGTLSLLGDSGCGKSMTLRCIAGIDKPDEGKIIINGKTVFDSEKKINLKPQERRVGYLFQDYALFPNMTVEENIVAGMERDKVHSKEEKKKIAQEYIEKLQLNGLSKQYPDQLSGGQKQRCALARILASDPDIILLDEPFSALDAALRWDMEQVVRETIQKFEGSSVLVSHDRDEVYRLSDKIAVYNKGHIDTFDDKWNLFENPQTMITARLTGCKNLSSAHREGDRIIADDWDISFPCEKEGDWNYLGIRAHRFMLAEAEEDYAFPYEVVNKIEDTFSYIFQIRKAGSPEAKTVRWETEKEIGANVPDSGFVKIDPKELLLLK